MWQWINSFGWAGQKAPAQAAQPSGAPEAPEAPKTPAGNAPTTKVINKTHTLPWPQTAQPLGAPTGDTATTAVSKKTRINPQHQAPSLSNSKTQPALPVPGQGAAAPAETRTQKKKAEKAKKAALKQELEQHVQGGVTRAPGKKKLRRLQREAKKQAREQKNARKAALKQASAAPVNGGTDHLHRQKNTTETALQQEAVPEAAQAPKKRVYIELSDDEQPVGPPHKTQVSERPKKHTQATTQSEATLQAAEKLGLFIPVTQAPGDQAPASGTAPDSDDELVFLGGTIRPRNNFMKRAIKGTAEAARSMQMVRDTFYRQRDSALELNKGLPEHAKLPGGTLVLTDHYRDPKDVVVLLPYDGDRPTEFVRKEMTLQGWIERCNAIPQQRRDKAQACRTSMS